MFEHILLPLDGSNLAERVLPHAVALGKGFSSKLTLLRVVSQDNRTERSEIVNPMDWQMRLSEAESYLYDVQRRLRSVDLDADVQVREGDPARAIIQYAQAEDVQLIILSSHGKSGISEWNINSVVQKALLRAYMPVMIVRPYQETPKELSGLKYHRIMVPLDGSKRAECVLPLAKSIGELNDARLFLAHIVEEPRLPRQTPLSADDQALVSRLQELNKMEARKYLDEITGQFSTHNLQVIIESSKKPSTALHDLVDRLKIDLVMMSAHGYSGENRWPYGNIALNFIAYGTTPLLINQDLSEEEVARTMAEKFSEESKGH